jgi:ABC-type transport system involved in cytochrome c biogenesis permease subunit
MTNSLLFGISIFVYFFSMVLYVSYLAFRSEGLGKVATLTLFSGVLVETAAILLRWYESYQMGIGRAPLTNLYESLVFFALTIAIFYLFMERKFKIKTVGAFVTPFPFIIIAYASLNPMSFNPLFPR